MFFFDGPQIPKAWSTLDSDDKLHDLLAQSHTTPQIIFKHSTRCSRSHFAMERLSSDEKMASLPEIHYLDLIQFRSTSNAVSDKLNITHQSPQILVVHNGKCTYSVSHEAIDPVKILDKLEVLNA